MKSELQEKIEAFAYSLSKPFCYSCYEEAPSGRCKLCASDDIMRLIPGVGVEWGVDWVIRHLIEDRLTPVNVSEHFEQSVRGIYPEEVTVGWMTLDSVSIMKEMDPTSWRIAQSEWADQEVNEGNLLTFDHGSSYYSISDIEKLIEGN